MKDIFTAYTKAQKEFNKAVKDSTNPHYKSKYANIESVIDAISSALGSHGLAFIQPISSDNGQWFICTKLIHESGESFESPKVEIIIQEKNNPQKFGSSLTYFRRYSLMAFFGIPDTDDDGNIASGKKPTEVIELENKLKEKENAILDLTAKLKKLDLQLKQSIEANKKNEAPKNHAPQNNYEAYVMKSGPYAGKKFAEVNLIDLKTTVNKFESSYNPTNPGHLEFFDAYNAYLKSLGEKVNNVHTEYQASLL